MAKTKIDRSVERKIEETYDHIEPYLNNPECVPLLHEMCQNCEMWNGVEEHDYHDCFGKACFTCFLGFEYVNWSSS